MQNAEFRVQSAEPTSAFCILHSALCILFLASSALGAQSQNIGPVTFRDSLVMRQLVFRAPCPDPVPRAWTQADSTLGRPPRCNLVEAAARAIYDYYTDRPPRTGPVDPWNPMCVRIVVARNTGSTGLPGDWLVMFDLAVEQHGLRDHRPAVGYCREHNDDDRGFSAGNCPGKVRGMTSDHAGTSTA
jgi:hypothetical protein